MKKQWKIFWEIPECPPFLTSEPARFFTTKMKNFCGDNFTDCILEYKNNTNIWYLDANEWSRYDKVLFDKIIKNKKWSNKINSISEKYCLPCFDFLGSLTEIDYKKLSNTELWKSYDRFMKIYVPAHASGHPANVLEMKNQRLSKHLKTYLLNRQMNTKVQGSADELFSILTEPVENMSVHKEAKSFYELANYILKSKDLVKLFNSESNINKFEVIISTKFPLLWKKISKHRTDWSWTMYNWEGPANTIENYLGTLSSLIRQKIDVGLELNKLKERKGLVTKEQDRLFKELAVDSRYKELFKIASDIMYLKSLRKDCMYKAAWATEGMYSEIGRRIGLSVHEARFIFYFEMREAILEQKINKKEIYERTSEVVLHQRKNKKDRLFVGDKALKFISSLKVKQPDKNIKEIKGQVAYPGKVVGVVKYINTPDMMHKMNQGDILLAYATQPNLLPAMKKAVAFITDFGGITCHAAIVAREWKVPCVIGTKIATKVLKDGDLVEVDANSGVVKIIKRYEK